MATITTPSNAPVGLSHGPGVFADEEFERAAREVVSPDLQGWDFFVESKNTRIYRRYKEESGLYEYKIVGLMEDLDPELSAQVYVDWEYRKVWDSYVMDLHPVKDDSSGMEGLYCAQYTFVRDMKVLELSGVKTYVVLAKSQPFSGVPEKEGVIRVTDFQQACVMQSDGKVGSKAFMHYYDNPKGMIPSWLINWAAKTGVPQFIDMMRKAVFGYRDFLEERRRELGLDTMDNEQRLRQLYSVSASDPLPHPA